MLEIAKAENVLEVPLLQNSGGDLKKLHSVKVPRLYKEASKALQNIEQNGEGLKTAIYSIKHPVLV